MNEGLGFEDPGKARKIASDGLAGLAGLRENRYIPGNLWYLMRSRLRVGPTGPALFYYLNVPARMGRQTRFGESAGSPLIPA